MGANEATRYLRLQGYLAHEKPPAPPGPCEGPTQSPTVGSKGKASMSEVPLYSPLTGYRPLKATRHLRDARIPARPASPARNIVSTITGLELRPWQQVSRLNPPLSSTGPARLSTGVRPASGQMGPPQDGWVHRRAYLDTDRPASGP